MTNHFHIVAVGIEDVGGKIIGVMFRSQFRCAVVASAGLQRGGVEGVDLLTPVGGEVVEVNEALRADPSLANSDPLVSGWFFKVRLADPAEIGGLMDQAAYDALVKAS